jgi:hypothetical protein
MRNCVICQRPFKAQRPQARFCGSTCRVRAHRLPGAVVPMKAQTPDVSQMGHLEDDLVAAVKAELAAAGCDGSSLGAQAIQLARRMAPGTFDTGSAYASLSKELRSVMAQAMAGATQAADPLDELKARRDAKRLRGTGG